jgi:hypothetical protein
MEPITRAKTCQNCKFSLFGQRNEIFGGGGKKINGLCMRYADAPIPRQFDVHNYVSYGLSWFGGKFPTWRGEEYKAEHPIELQFKNARKVEELPIYEDFREAVLDNPCYRYPNETTEESIRGWYDGCYTWSAWWIRNWKTVAERRIDRTTVCEAWDGTQTSKFYKAKKHG